jgi:hypothetical protein
VLIIDDDVRTAIHEPDKDRQYADRIAVGLIELFAEQPTHLGVCTRGNAGYIDELFTTR